jgi:hypothetical protein
MDRAIEQRAIKPLDVQQISRGVKVCTCRPLMGTGIPDPAFCMWRTHQALTFIPEGRNKTQKRL